MNDSICLLYPPASVHEFPHMALPHLKACLKKSGYQNVRTIDLNAPIMKQLIWSRLYRVTEHYQTKDLDVPLKAVERNFNLAKDILFDKHDRGKDEWAIAIMNAYHKMAGSNISEVCFTPNSLSEIIQKHKQRYTDTITNILTEKVKEIALQAPDIIGITTPMASQLFYAFFIGREIKKHLPNVKVVLGGSQVSIFGELISQSEVLLDAYDHMVCGEGEESICQYIKYINCAAKESDVPGLMYRDHTGKIILNPKAETVDPNIPMPDFGDYNIEDYIYPKLPYMMNKGCYWSRCAFCSYRNNYPFVKRNVESIADDIQTLKQKHNTRFFHFIDDAIPPDVLSDFSDQILRRDVPIKYENYLRLDPNFTLELCKKIAKSGLRSALFGLESANLRILKLMKKGIALSNAQKVLKNMKSSGIKTIVSCMIGFPTETEAEAKETISFLIENKDVISQSFLVRYGLISDMKDCAETYGIYDIVTDDLVRYDDAGFVALGYAYKTYSGMISEEIIDMVKQAREKVEGPYFQDCFFS